MPTRTRAALVTVLALVSCAVLAGPASAATTSPGSVMDQQVDVMTPGTALMIFLGIPLLVVALVWLLVSAPGWTRDGRPSDSEAWTGEPVVVGAAAPAASLEAGASDGAAEDDGATGGTSAAW
jgi:hypothetical protein